MRTERTGSEFSAMTLVTIGAFRIGLNLTPIMILLRYPSAIAAIAVTLLVTFVIPALEVSVFARLVRRLGLVKDLQ